MNIDVLSKLTEIIEDRNKSEHADSYVASLNHQGLNKLLENIGEESVETIPESDFCKAMSKRLIPKAITKKQLIID